MPPTHFDTDRATFITDLDDCGADFSGEIVRTWNRERGADLTVGEVNTWIETGDPMHEIFERPGFFRNLRPHDGFAEALRGIQDAGVDVVVATAAVGAPPPRRRSSGSGSTSRSCRRRTSSSATASTCCAATCSSTTRRTT